MKRQRNIVSRPLPSQCPLCGSRLMTKAVEEVVKGGDHTAVFHVRAGVCTKCGGRLYAPSTVKRFEQAREKLKRNEVRGFTPLGRTFAAS